MDTHIATVLLYSCHIVVYNFCIQLYKIVLLYIHVKNDVRTKCTVLMNLRIVWCNAFTFVLVSQVSNLLMYLQ